MLGVGAVPHRIGEHRVITEDHRVAITVRKHDRVLEVELAAVDFIVITARRTGARTIEYITRLSATGQQQGHRQEENSQTRAHAGFR